MTEKVDTPISVTFNFNHYLRTVRPQKIIWDGREYLVTKIGLHHTFRRGQTLFHIFSVLAGNIFFRLELDTANLFWRLQEISDGQPS